MTHSAASYDRLRDTSDVIDGHLRRVDGKVQVIARSRSKVDHAAGGIYSSIADLSKWVQLHLQAGGKYREGQGLLSPGRVPRALDPADHHSPVGGGAL